VEEATAEVKEEAIIKMKALEVIKRNIKDLEIQEKVMTKTNAEVLTTILIPKKMTVIHPHQEDLIRELNHPMDRKLINR
jgi:hypothetical protein